MCSHGGYVKACSSYIDLVFQFYSSCRIHSDEVSGSLETSITRNFASSILRWKIAFRMRPSLCQRHESIVPRLLPTALEREANLLWSCLPYLCLVSRGYCARRDVRYWGRRRWRCSSLSGMKTESGDLYHSPSQPAPIYINAKMNQQLNWSGNSVVGMYNNVSDSNLGWIWPDFRVRDCSTMQQQTSWSQVFDP